MHYSSMVEHILKEDGVVGSSPTNAAKSSSFEIYTEDKRLAGHDGLTCSSKMLD